MTKYYFPDLLNYLSNIVIFQGKKCREQTGEYCGYPAGTIHTYREKTTFFLDVGTSSQDVRSTAFVRAKSAKN